MKRIPVISAISNIIYPYLPGLKKKLTMAGIEKEPLEFLDWVIASALLFSILLTALTALILHLYYINPLYSLIVFFITFPIFFYYYLHYPDVLIIRRRKALERDLVFAMKHLIISVSSGMPLFDAIASLTRGYGAVSREFKEVVEAVSTGEPLPHVLKEKASRTPSPAFKRVLIQLANAVVSGADIERAMSAIVDQIAKEQLIEVKEYGQKLNPIIMFYLILGVIIPSLGITFLIILLSFVSGGVQFPFYYLLIVAALVGLFQFLFLAYVESSRPRYTMIG